MQNKDLISVFVPVYNAEKFIEECMLSIINQDYENLDYFVTKSKIKFRRYVLFVLRLKMLI